jgi:hypothetical protein
MESSESPLRQFLYLDVPLVTDLLSQLEGGSYDSETRTTGETRSRGLKGEVGVGIPFVSLKGGGGKDKASREEVQRTIERTDTVRFAQLYRLLMDQAKIQELATVDQGIWEQLEPSEFVEIQAMVAPSSVAKTVDMLFAKSKMLANVFTALGYDVAEDTRSAPSTQSLPDQQELAIVKPSKESTTRRGPVPAIMKLIVLLARFDLVKAFPKLQVIAILVGSPEYKFVAHLDRKYLLFTSLTELSGEMKVLGRLEQKMADSYRIGGLWLEPRVQAWDDIAKRSFVEPPIAIFQPVAIYR